MGGKEKGEVVEMGEVGGRDGRKETKEGGRKKVKEPVEKGRINILFLSPLPCTSDHPHSPTAPGSVIPAAVNFVAVRCFAEPFAVSHTLTLVPIKIGTSRTLLWTNAFTCLGVLDER